MYSIKQVAQMLGIPTVTLRAWESRYQAVTPERTESGYRLYSHSDVEDLRWLKDQTERQGISISHAVRMLKADKEQRDREVQSPEVGTPQEAFEKMKNQIYDALLEFQGERANALIDFGFSLYSYETMFHQVLAPLLVKVGDAWEKGEATVAQEHYMTHTVSTRFYQFFHVFPVYPHLPQALAFCPEGEHHQVGLLLFSLFLRKNGMEVIYLGANTPEEGVLSMLDKQKRIGVICVSVTGREQVDYTEGLLRRLKQAYPRATFIVGGKGYETAGGSAEADYIMSGQSGNWKPWFDQAFGSGTAAKKQV